MDRTTRTLLFLGAMCLLPATLFAQTPIPAASEEFDKPYFVTYNQHMEEPGALEIGLSPVWGRPKGANNFVGSWLEFEYGATRWWTSEFYVDWQHTAHEGNLFTGWRFENRFRVLAPTHRIIPVLYIEYEHLNGADKIIKEVVGFEGKADLEEPNDVTRHEREREVETKLILSSQIKGWNVAENFIGSKNVHEGRWEFGYAVGVSRPLSAATTAHCPATCLDRFTVGLEMYGGLGEWGAFTLRGTSQYLAPVIRWQLPSETTIRFSPGWGITDDSIDSLYRFGFLQEIDGVGKFVSKLFGH